MLMCNDDSVRKLTKSLYRFCIIVFDSGVCTLRFSSQIFSRIMEIDCDLSRLYNRSNNVSQPNLENEP